jgi:hypothetical protein
MQSTGFRILSYLQLRLHDRKSSELYYDATTLRMRRGYALLGPEAHTATAAVVQLHNAINIWLAVGLLLRSEGTELCVPYVYLL